MKTIKKQIIASTNSDLHGDKLSKEELHYLYLQIHEHQMVNQSHDLSKKPVGKMYNKQFIQLGNGEYAIAVDIDVYDEEIVSKMGGVSISYTKNTITQNPYKNPDIEILINPLLINIEQLKDIVQLSTDEIQIDAVELRQKGLEGFPIVILKFVAYSVAAGFFGTIGSGILDKLRSKLKELSTLHKKNKNQDIKYHFEFTANKDSHPFKVLIEMSAEDISLIENKTVSLDSAMEYISKVAGKSKIQKIVMRAKESEPFWETLFFVDSKGQVINL